MSPLTLPLTSRPFLSWEGKDVLGNFAKIEGDPENGFSFCVRSDEEYRWREPANDWELRCIVSGFLADCMAKQAGVQK